jgi:hypothetical protein
MIASILPIAFTWSATHRVSTPLLRSPTTTPADREIAEGQGAVLRSCVQNNLVTVVEQSARSGAAETVGTAGDQKCGWIARLGGAGRQPDRAASVLPANRRTPKERCSIP